MVVRTSIAMFSLLTLYGALPSLHPPVPQYRTKCGLRCPQSPTSPSLTRYHHSAPLTPPQFSIFGLVFVSVVILVIVATAVCPRPPLLLAGPAWPHRDPRQGEEGREGRVVGQASLPPHPGRLEPLLLVRPPRQVQPQHQGGRCRLRPIDSSIVHAQCWTALSKLYAGQTRTCAHTIINC